jgi:uncharacterized membrane protein YeaQ/YmgE (transglycosylase-associated protein family)
MHLMWFLWIALVGLIVGAIAKLLMPGRDPGGFLITMLLGIAGGLLATWFGRIIGLYREGARAGFIMSILGAMFLLWIYRVVQRRRTVT